MTSELAIALARANLAMGLGASESLRRTDEVLLKNHQDEMRRINEHYDKLRSIFGRSPAKKEGKKWWNLKLF